MAATRELLAPALPASLDEVQDLVQLLWDKDPWVALTDRIRFECAVAEIAANIIEHSVPASDCGTVVMTVTVSCTAIALTAIFTDNASPAVLDLAGAVMPGPAAEHGRGLSLARAASDVLRYERTGLINEWTVECLRGS